MTPSLERLELSIEGMTCASCVGHVTKALRRVDGVGDVSVNLATERAVIEHDARATREALVAAVEHAGYFARTPPDEESETRERLAALRSQGLGLLLGGSAAAVAMLLAMLPWQFAGDGALQAILSTGVWLTLGARFHRGAWLALRERTSTMDTLISLGSTAALILSYVNLVRGVPTFFETAAAIIVLISIGKYLEARAKIGSSQALRALLALRPLTAQRRRSDGRFESVALELVRVDDILAVAAGERIPVDGVVVEGSSAVDRAMLTGEPFPTEVAPGESVEQGTLNGDGALLVRARAVGAGTTLARITAIVARAQGSLPPVQRTADRIASIFVPIVLAIAAITLLGWLLTGHPIAPALIAAVAVLVVACPCALGLATPTAIVAGVGAGARHGILVKDADALERLAEINTVVLDKTGTLTSGAPRVVALVAPDAERDGMLARAAALEAKSAHPLARAILAEAAARSISIPHADDVIATRGRGISGIVDGEAITVGNADFLRGRDIAIDESANAGENVTPLYVAIGSRFVGSIQVADPLRENGRATIERLVARGLRVILASGDAERATANVARACDIDEWHAALLPEQKGDLVNALRESGARVAFIGDGINDAPALALADVGMAMGAGSAVALESAGTAALRDDPSAILDAITIGKATMRAINVNLFWALAYNVALIPLAAFGVVSPIFAAAAMGASSLFVVGNAMLLARK
ncbi:MAG TPA: cation-translocating P-type ATPase [Candidatus Dormibacteraeota bacterium]|nr:cation-translocating P-type ATPase [Candidatus Dormibacteraeota bacterium]